MSSSAVRSSLDALALGDLDVREARVVVRQAIELGEEMVERVYVALREVTWRMVSARRVPEDLSEWHDLGTHAAALAKKANRVDLSERILALSELLAQTGRFVDRQPTHEILRRKHVDILLRELALRESALSRVHLAEATGLGSANLSRILSLLEAHGLIQRNRSGKEAFVELTEAGQETAAKLGHAGAALRRPDAPAWWSSMPLPVIVWSPKGEHVGTNQAFRTLTGKIGYPTPSDASAQDWTNWLAGAITDERPSGEEQARDLRLGQGTWVRCIEHVAPNGDRVACLLDLSAPLNSLEASKREAAASEEINAGLKVQLAQVRTDFETRERQLLSFASAQAALRSVLSGNFHSLSSRLHSLMEASGSSDHLRDADRHLTALKSVMQLLVNEPAWARLVPRHEPLDVKLLIDESVGVVRALAHPDIDVDFKGLKLARADLPLLRAAIGRTLLTHVWQTRASKYFVEAAMKGNWLHVLCLASSGSGREVQRALRKHQLAVATEDLVIRHGLAYCRDLAESVGGTLQVGMTDEPGGYEFVEIVLPTATAAGKRQKARIGDG